MLYCRYIQHYKGQITFMKQKSLRVPQELLDEAKNRVGYIDNESELVRFALIHLLITLNNK